MPLVPVTVIVYVPKPAFFDVETVRVTDVLPPEESATLVELRVVPGECPVKGARTVDRLMVPANATLVRVIVDVDVELRVIVRLDGLAAIVKSPIVPVVNVAVWTVSGTGVGVPLTIVTQTLGLTLEFEHPVWNCRGIPPVAAVTL